MHGALLMADEDVLDPILLEQLVIDRQHGAARIAENVLDALIGERLEHHFCACHRARHLNLTGTSLAPRHGTSAAGKLEEWRKSLNKARTLRLA